MIKAVGTLDGSRQVVLLGMTLADLEPLKPEGGGHWLRVDLEDLGVGFDVTILVADDLEALTDQFERMKNPTMVN